MALLQRSIGKKIDWPQLESAAIAAVSAGSGNDPAQDTFIGAVPDLSLTGPTLKNQGGVYPNPYINSMWVRQVSFTSTGSANTTGGATNNYDWRVNVWRKGVLQGCVAYYPLSVNTTIGTAIVAGNVNSYVTVTPAAMTGIVTGMMLGVGSGATFEMVQVVSTSTTTFTAYWTQLHATNAAVTTVCVPYQPTAFVNAIGANTTSNTLIQPGSQQLSPASIYGLHVGDYITIAGGTTIEQVTATTVASTAFTANFLQPHAGTYQVAYYVATTSDTDITHASTTTITVGSTANMSVGQSLILQGTGADSAKTDTLTVSTINSTTSVTFTTSTSVNDYTATINITSVAYLSATTTVTAGKQAQVISMASTTGIAANDLVLIQDLTSNSATGAFTGTTAEVVLVQAVVTNTSITISPSNAHTNAYAVVPFTKTTSTTAVTTTGSQTITLASGTNFKTGQANVYIFGGTGSNATLTETVKITAVSTYGATATFTQLHSGAYTIQTASQTIANNNFGVNEPFTLIGGDTLTLQRLSNNATGLASPIGSIELEWVPAQIGQ